MHVFVCFNVSMSVFVQICVSVHVCVCVCVCVCVYVHTHACIFIRAYASVCVHLRICPYKLMCISAFVNACITCMHIQEIKNVFVIATVYALKLNVKSTLMFYANFDNKQHIP